jgi:hypothetical protein
VVAKQGWDIIHKPDLLVPKLLKAILGQGFISEGNPGWNAKTLMLTRPFVLKLVPLILLVAFAAMLKHSNIFAHSFATAAIP